MKGTKLPLWTWWRCDVHHRRFILKALTGCCGCAGWRGFDAGGCGAAVRTNRLDPENLTPTDRLWQPARVSLCRVSGSGFVPGFTPGSGPAGGGSVRILPSSSSSSAAAVPEEDPDPDSSGVWMSAPGLWGGIKSVFCFFLDSVRPGPAAGLLCTGRPVWRRTRSGLITGTLRGEINGGLVLRESEAQTPAPL